MKINNFDIFRKSIKLKNIKIRTLLKKEGVFDRKPRYEADRATLCQVDKMRWERKLKSNEEIEIIGPSKYKIII